MTKKPTERERNIALHGPLVVRIVDRMMRFRFDRAKHLIESKGIDFDGPSHLDRFAEATAIIAIVHAAKLADLPMSYDSDKRDDIGAYFRLYSLTEGHVLTEQDILDLEAVLAELNDEIGNQADKAQHWREETLREIGGEDLVTAVAEKDRKRMDEAVEKALAKFRASRPAEEVQS